MIDLTKIKEVYLFTGVTDFRLGINGLALKVKTQFHGKDINNMLFIFCSKKRNSLKILEFEEGAIWLYIKKLEYGEYIYPECGAPSNISIKNLTTIINGLDFIYKIEGKNTVKYDQY